MKYDMKKDDNFAYLINMPMNSVSKENVNKLMDEKKSKESTVPQKSNKRSWIHKIKDNG